MTKWYSTKEVPNYEEWILTEWYDEDGSVQDLTQKWRYEMIFIIGIILIIFGVYLFLNDFKYMLQGVILMILGASILGISLS